MPSSRRTSLPSKLEEPLAHRELVGTEPNRLGQAFRSRTRGRVVTAMFAPFAGPRWTLARRCHR